MHPKKFPEVLIHKEITTKFGQIPILAMGNIKSRDCREKNFRPSKGSGPMKFFGSMLLEPHLDTPLARDVAPSDAKTLLQSWKKRIVLPLSMN